MIPANQGVKVKTVAANDRLRIHVYGVGLFILALTTFKVREWLHNDLLVVALYALAFFLLNRYSPLIASKILAVMERFRA